jgi:hypothetical protein
MSKIIIHAGLHKTGTSAIQKFLHLNRDRLLELGINYPNTAPFEAHHTLAARLCGYSKSELNLAIKDVNRTMATLKGLSPLSTLVISSEMLCEGLDPRVFKYLHKLFDKVEFHFYIRKQSDLIESAYNQQVKQNAESRLINEYTPYFENIYKQIKWFEKSVEKSKIITHIYDKALFINLDIADDFCQKVLNLNLNVEIEKLKSVKTNASLSIPACLLMTKINKIELDKSTRKEVLKYLTTVLPASEYDNYKLLSNEDEIQLIERTSINNVLLDEEYVGFAYMSQQVERPLMTMTLEKALSIAKEKGIINEVNKKFKLVIN